MISDFFLTTRGRVSAGKTAELKGNILKLGASQKAGVTDHPSLWFNLRYLRDIALLGVETVADSSAVLETNTEVTSVRKPQSKNPHQSAPSGQ